jgi:hypothetical protein
MPCWSCVREKIPGPAGCGRQMIQRIHQGLLAEGIEVPLTRLCAWFGVPRRTVCYRPAKEAPKIDPRFAEPIKAMIEQEPSFGYRTAAWFLGFNKNYSAACLSAQGLANRRENDPPGSFSDLPHSSTATPASCWAGICRDPARPRPQPARWSVP